MPGKPSMDVLPFDSLSGDTEQEYFADGITNDIITDLSKFSEALRDRKALDIRLQGQAGEGTTGCSRPRRPLRSRGQRITVGGQIRINAQLLDVTSGRYLWARSDMSGTS